MNWRVTSVALVCCACVVSHAGAQYGANRDIVSVLTADHSASVAQDGNEKCNGMKLTIDEINVVAHAEHGRCRASTSS